VRLRWPPPCGLRYCEIHFASATMAVAGRTAPHGRKARLLAPPDGSSYRACMLTHDGRRWSNAEADRVDLVPYDPSWPARFAAEAAAIRAALGDGFAYEVLHAGSTAVPGLAAKPIVDVVLAVPDRTRWPSLVPALTGLGYVYWAENPDTTTMFFVKGMPPYGTGRTHHVHVHGPYAAATVVRFRDHLIAHPEDAARYEALKRDLAVRFPTDRDAYTKGKGAFVEAALRASGPR
jgi:GrpB-like predicted nucleotidyltransferase (UPF0157 family)